MTLACRPLDSEGFADFDDLFKHSEFSFRFALRKQKKGGEIFVSRLRFIMPDTDSSTFPGDAL